MRTPLHDSEAWPPVIFMSSGVVERSNGFPACPFEEPQAGPAAPWNRTLPRRDTRAKTMPVCQTETDFSARTEHHEPKDPGGLKHLKSMVLGVGRDADGIKSLVGG
jgi:hypothetical protein